MTQIERIALWAGVTLALLASVVSTALLYGELADVRTQLEIVAGARPGGGVPTSAPQVPADSTTTWGTSLTVRVLGATQPVTATALITLSVRGSGAADPLLELPILACDGEGFPVEGASLEQARQDLLALITRGEARATLRFVGAPDLHTPCTLVLNPAQPIDSVVAPRIDVPLPRHPASPP